MKTMKLPIVLFILSISFFFSSNNVFSQEKEKEPLSFRDSLDNCLDLSDWIINKNGFVPMPIVITEKALGGFGGGLVPVFIKQNAPVVKNGKVYPSLPDMTAAFGAYTLNDSWMVGAARTGTIRKWGLRYGAFAAYGSVNMDYYFYLDKMNKDVNMEFNIKTIPFGLFVSKQLPDPRFSIGLQYLFMRNDVKLVDKNNNDNAIIEKFEQKFGDYISGKVSGDIAKLGLKASFDTRDNAFTPNKGTKTYLTGEWSNPVVGSDYKYGQFEGAFYSYFPLSPTLITGTRLDIQQIVGDQPFYVRPFIDMRGVPSARYSGKSTALAELEERWDFINRWSLVFFGGGGKAFDKYSEFKDAEWAWGAGTGFRYLMARKLKLRMGVDFAVGPEGFTYYLVFGNAWLRQ